MAYASTLEISRDADRASKVGSHLLGLQLVLASGTVFLCLGVGAFLYRGPGEHVLWLVILVLSGDLVLKTIKGTLRFLLKGLQLFGTEAASLFIERVLLMTLGLLALKKGYGALGYALVFLIVRIPDTLGLWAYVDAFVVRLRPAIDTRMWRDLILKGLPFAYTGVMVSLLFLVDNLLLEKISGTRETGLYGVPVQILEGLTLVPRVVSYALLPTMAAAWARAPGEVTPIYRRGLKYLLLVGLPLAAFGVISSSALIPLVFGSQYAASIPLAQIVIPISVLMFVSNFSETTLFCINRWRTLVLVSTLALFLDLTLAIVLIPRWGAEGAAFARLIGEGSYALMTAGAVFRAGHRPGFLRLLVRPAVCATCFGSALWGLSGHGLLLAVSGSGLVWAIATVVFGVWDEKEKDLVRGFLGRP